jgi:hypothetical protein
MAGEHNVFRENDFFPLLFGYQLSYIPSLRVGMTGKNEEAKENTILYVFHNVFM